MMRREWYGFPMRYIFQAYKGNIALLCISKGAENEREEGMNDELWQNCGNFVKKQNNHLSSVII